MPLMKYFVFVGAALVLLLLAMNWILPDPSAEPVYSSSIERPVIRVNSIRTPPERVVFDTSTPPYVVSPPSVFPGAAQPLQSAFTQMAPSSLPTGSLLAQAHPKKPIVAKREPAKKLVTNRVAPKAPVTVVKNEPVRESEQDTKAPVKTTFLDEIAGRFVQMFKVN